MSTSEEWLYNDVLDVDVTDVSLQAADDVPTFKNVFFCVVFYTPTLTKRALVGGIS